MVGSKKEPNAPSQSDRKPTLIVPPFFAVESPPPPPPSSSEPQPAATSASASVAPVRAITFLGYNAPLLSSPSIDTACRGTVLHVPRRPWWRRAATAPPPSQPIAGLLPEAHQAARRGEDDDQEDKSDDRVEPSRSQDVADLGHPLARVVVDQRVGQRARPRPLQPVKAADDGDDEDVDRLGEVDRARRDAAVVPDGEHAGDGRDDRREAEREDPVAGDVEPQRAHTGRFVTHPLERQPERRARDPAEHDEDEHG